MSVLYDFHVQLVVLYRGVLYKKELRVNDDKIHDHCDKSIVNDKCLESEWI